MLLIILEQHVNLVTITLATCWLQAIEHLVYVLSHLSLWSVPEPRLISSSSTALSAMGRSCLASGEWWVAMATSGLNTNS